jgi:hypothetical protein
MATIGIKYVTEDANTDDVSLINKLKTQKANPLPKIPRIFIKRKFK